MATLFNEGGEAWAIETRALVDFASRMELAGGRRSGSQATPQVSGAVAVLPLHGLLLPHGGSACDDLV